MSAPMAGPPPSMPPPPPTYGMPPPMPMQQHTALPIAGGALLIVAGILGLVEWGLTLAAGSAAASVVPGLGAILAICGAIGIIFSLIALIGGVFAIQRKMWGLALAGSILGLFSIGFFIGSILSLVALILVAISRKEFH